MNVLLDTNVVVDAVTGRAPHNAAAEEIFLLAAHEEISASITAISVTDVYYLLHKHLHDHGECKRVLNTLFGLFKILDVTESDCRKALTESMPDYEDALMAVCAKRNKIDLIVTRNLKDFEGSSVQAVEPEAFLASTKTN